MQTEEVTLSVGDKLRAYFTDNPTAATVATARKFACDAGYVSSIKKEMGLARRYQAAKKPVKKVKSITRTDGTFKSGAVSKRQQITHYFRENPDASPAAVAKKFSYSPGATHNCKQEAKKTPLSPQPPEWVRNLTGPLPAKSGQQQGFDYSTYIAEIADEFEPPKLDAVIDQLDVSPKQETGLTDPWRAFGLWMTREQYTGYLRGLAVSKLSRPLASHKDMLEINRIVTKLAELTGS